ncbi:hypothetical protein Srubr_34320 [Streptomyces rubradiris]|uniref:Uncharacterized protein n=1 Tax=Streptomyces rubradiris TaxID=285531 RepID=A0ABQ3RCK3_STRRR|nr:hypothetical protein GCM10018792_03250 [Streptomyces rubradiris]GHI53586.1 hypothetical protein Srubr_34320 [Streptomyces rubradiris]
MWEKAPYWGLLGGRAKHSGYTLFAFPIERMSAHLVNLGVGGQQYGVSPTPTVRPGARRSTTVRSGSGNRRHRVRNRLSHQTRAGARRHGVDCPVCPEGDPTHKECAVTPEKTNREQRPEERAERGRRRPGELGSLEVWARSAPIRLAGYEDDLAEPHILPSVD